VIPLKTDATLNPFCAHAHFQAVCIISFAYRGGGLVFIVLPYLVSAVFTFPGSRAFHVHLAT
jgi:hypothetical protein